VSTEQFFPVFLSESEMLLALEALQECEKNQLRHHSPEKAQAFGNLADRLIEAGQRAV
jgi:hypothetical protein